MIFYIIPYTTLTTGDNFALDERTNSNLVAMNNWLPSEPVKTATASPQQVVENWPLPNITPNVQNSQNLEGELISPLQQNFKENSKSSEDFPPPPCYNRQP